MNDIEIVFKQVESLEAMAMIDENNCDNLYFAYEYYESPYDFGYTNLVKPVPSHLKIGDPIKYKEWGRTKFFKKGKVNEPKEQKETAHIIPKGHKWLVKEVSNDGKHLKAPEGLPRKPKKVTLVL